jgi:hypothetical protein
MPVYLAEDGGHIFNFRCIKSRIYPYWKISSVAAALNIKFKLQFLFLPDDEFLKL